MKSDTYTGLFFVSACKALFICILSLTTTTSFAQTFISADITGDLGQVSYGATMGDINGDGYLDIYVANFSNQQNKLWINDGVGNFTANNISGDLNSSNDSVMGDVNGDGFSDIYVANAGQNKLWINDGLGNFTDNDIFGDEGTSNDAIMGDIDGDDDLDIYVANTGQNKLWINDGLGNFTDNDISGDVGTTTSYGAAIGDIDGDGDLDIYAANYGGKFPEQNKLWINDGTGNFSSVDIINDLGRSYSAVMGDVDGDTDLDIYVANTGQNKLWINDGLGNFIDNDIFGDEGTSNDAIMSDIDGDGDLDIYVANIGQQNKLWINDGSGNFVENVISEDEENSNGIAIGDVNSDGFLDIYVANNSQQNRLWLQVPPTYTIRFLDFDSTVLNTQTATSGEDAIVPTAPTRDGYTFTGWNPSDLTNITEDIDFIAQYSLIPPSSSGSSATSIPSRVRNLIAQGDQEAADKIIEQRPELFDPIATTLADLKKQLADLTAKYKAITGHDPVISTFTLGTRDLTLNDIGTDVELLQRFLIAEGYSIPAGPTTFFGTQTEAALAQFQSDKSITPALGYYGSITRDAITKLYMNVTWG